MSDRVAGHQSATELPKIFNWPKFQWRMGLLFTIASFLLTSILLIFPNLSEGRFSCYRIFLIVFMIVGPFIIISVLPWLFKVVLTITKRVDYYPALLEISKTQQQDLTNMRNAIAELLQNIPKSITFEIKRASFTNGKLYILLRKSDGNMIIGDRVEIIDTEDGMSMGQFKVTEIRMDVYYAEEIGHIDPVWSGYIREKGETEVIPHMKAIYIPRGG